MIAKYLKILIFMFAALLLATSAGLAQQDVNEQHIKVSMRMIGHEILLSLGDSSSRVLPIEKEVGRYGLQFEKELQFSPDLLVSTIDRVVQQSGIASSYLVEVEDCQSHKVVYSYEIGNSVKQDLIPCLKRVQPKGCYQIFLTILETDNSMASLFTASSKASSTSPSEPATTNYFTIILWFIPLLILIGFLMYFQKNMSTSKTNPNIIPMGQYQFNRQNMELSLKDESVELSSKEADLLFLLLSSVNNTLEREHILKTVWGDEGSYIGRTLDVFISKLRKKLEGDASVKIVNVRGIGYKLVLEG